MSLADERRRAYSDTLVLVFLSCVLGVQISRLKTCLASPSEGTDWRGKVKAIFLGDMKHIDVKSKGSQMSYTRKGSFLVV